MEAIRTLIDGDLAPAGRPIILTEHTGSAVSRSTGQDGELPLLSGYSPTWVNSGTAALALALLDARYRRPDAANPEVILPGYCCPDLVSACVFAGVKAVAADIAVNDITFDLEGISTSINKNTIAIIGVTLLGIRQDWSEIRPWLNSNHPEVLVIEDNAQWLPTGSETATFDADYIIFSFGRGKPLSLLGGGGVLSTKELLPATRGTILPAPSGGGFFEDLKFLAYNALLHPNLYQLLNRNPLLKLGKTRYSALKLIQELDIYRMNLLKLNFQDFRRCGHDLEHTYHEELNKRNCINLIKGINTSRQMRLLRFPFLCPTQEVRNSILVKLMKNGLGATGLYQKALCDMQDTRHMVRFCHELQNSRSFASRLITLPIHPKVKPGHINRMVETIFHFCDEKH